MADELPLKSKKKILAIVGAIPCRNNIYAGIFTIEQIIELAKTGKYKIDVIFVRPMFPKLTNWIVSRIAKNTFVLDRPIRARREGVNVHLIPYLHLPKLSTFMMIFTTYVYILFRRLEFDIIHAYFLFFPGYLGIKLGNLFRKLVVVTAMGSDVGVLYSRSVYGKAVKPKVIKKIMTTLEKADFVVAKSNYLKKIITELGVPENRVLVINNGVSRDTFHLLDMKGRPSNGKRKIILYVGSLFVEKGLLELMEAVEILGKKRDDFSLVVIGSGPLKDELLRLIERSKLQKFVSLEGQKDHEEIPQWINKSYVLCLPSHNEGLPNVALESISCGRPVVASNIGGIPEIINNSELGILFPPRDSQKLAKALEEALDKEWKHEIIAKSAERFYWENILPKFDELYRELI